MGKLSRRKGHAFEREIATAFREHGYPEAKRHLEYQAQEALGVDLDNTGPWRVQCKRGRRLAPLSALWEAVSPDGVGVPLLITRGDGGVAVAALPFEAFLRLLDALNDPV